jgi:hypothetical protein
MASSKAVGTGDIVEVFRKILLEEYAFTNSSVLDAGADRPGVSPTTLNGKP